MKQVTVTIPATSANLGPGFDCLGVALDLYHTVTFTAVDTPGLTITAEGEDAHKIPTNISNLVWESAESIFRHVGQWPGGLHIHQHNCIPVGSGLGSSSSAVLAGMFGANALVGNPLRHDEILQMATDLEGHPDNVAPAVYGGLVLGILESGGLIAEKISVPDMQVTVVLPDFKLLTVESRNALPRQVSFADAIFNISRLALVIRALETADYNKLAVAMKDRLHQQYRIPLIPGMADAFIAAKAAGATAVALSGAGPSLIAFAPTGHQAISAAAVAAFATAGLKSRTWILNVDTKGARVRSE